MELRPTIHHRFGVLRHPAVQNLHRIVGSKADGVKVAGPQAPATAHTVGRVHRHLFGGLIKDQPSVGTLLLALPASPAGVGGNLRRSTAVLLGFARPGAAAHADIFDGPAKAGHLMALEVGQTDKHIRIHNGTTDFRLFHVLAAPYRDIHVIGALQAVAD